MPWPLGKVPEDGFPAKIRPLILTVNATCSHQQAQNYLGGIKKLPEPFEEWLVGRLMV